MGVATSLTNPGEICRKRMLFEEAVACWKKSLLRAQEIGNRLGGVIAHGNAGNVVALLQGRERGAMGHLGQALLLASEIGSVPLVLEVFVGVMHLRVSEGCFQEVAALEGKVEAPPRFNAEI